MTYDFRRFFADPDPDDEPIAPPDAPGAPSPEDEPLAPDDVLAQFAQALLGSLDEEEEPRPVFEPGGDNTEFFAMVHDEESILDNLEDMFMDELQKQMEGLGYPREAGFQAFDHWSQEYGGWIDSWLQQANKTRDNFSRMMPGMDAEGFASVQASQTMGMDYFLGTLEGFEQMVQRGWDFWRQRIPGLGEFGQFTKPKRPPGGGRRRLSAQDIRNSFDLDQLTDATRGIWQQMVLDEPDNARSIAQSYIDAVVAVRAEKEIDFKTFVKNKARETGRYKTIYKNKPSALSEEQFLLPYHQSAMKVARPEEAADIAIGGAQFGASSSAFAQRLRRTDAATSSAPFVNELQNRLSDLRGVLRG